jgi:hypothetical protein
VGRFGSLAASAIHPRTSWRARVTGMQTPSRRFNRERDADMVSKMHCQPKIQPYSRNVYVQMARFANESPGPAGSQRHGPPSSHAMTSDNARQRHAMDSVK